MQPASSPRSAGRPLRVPPWRPGIHTLLLLLLVSHLVVIVSSWSDDSSTDWSAESDTCDGGDCSKNDDKGFERSDKRKKTLKAASGPVLTRTTAGGVSSVSAPNVTIVPPFLNLKARPLCMPAVEKLEVINTAEHDDLHLFAVSTDTVHFHPSSFKQTVVPPKGRTAISVVFVPRVLGGVDGTLIIETSVGGFLYQVRGEGIPNPYRLTPFLGAKVPVGVPFNPPIQIYNPNDVILHVKEVFTNEGFLHLTLPKSNSADHGSAGLWEIAPLQSNTIINLSFLSNVPGKHTGFVHVKTDIDNMIIPVEIQVIKGGIHRMPEELDFGTLTSPTDKRSLTITLLNSGPQPIQVTDIYSSSPDSHLYIVFKKGTVLVPSVEVEIATVVYAGRSEGQFMGKLLMRTNDTSPSSSRVQVPYKARVLHGSLGYNPINATFAVGSPPFKPIVQTLEITNDFPVPLYFTNADIADPNFEVVGFTHETVVPPGGPVPPVSIRFKANSTDMLYTTHLRLSTNASVLLIPLYCYHGKLVVTAEEEGDSVDFGLLGVNEARSRSFNLSNPNPVVVSVLTYNTTLQGLEVRLDSIWNPEGFLLSGRDITSRSRGSSRTGWDPRSDVPFLTLEPGHLAIFTMELFTSMEEERTGEILFKTAYESLSLPVKYKSLQGTLSFIPALIRFEPSFPGRVLKKPIHAKSTYSCPLHITSIASSDVRLVPVLTNTTLFPNVRMTIGYVLFDPAKGSSDENYMTTELGSAMTSEDGSKLSGPGEPLTEEDVKAMHRRDQLWDELVRRGAVDVRAILTLNTDVAMGCSLSVRASLSKPSIVLNDTIDFALTQIGTSDEQSVSVHNPADHPVHVQLVKWDRGSNDSDSNSSASFLLPAAATEGTVVPAHSDALLGPIRFVPRTQQSVSTTLLVKNNLTLLHTVTMRGEGGSGLLVFKDKGRRVEALAFDVNASHLGFTQTKEDEWTLLPKQAEGLSAVSLTRTFMAVNLGNLPVEVRSMDINGRGCDQFGFKLHHCEPFTLVPGETLNVSISFHPDFSASLVKRDLFVYTSLGILRFPLRAQLPHHLLSQCSDAQPQSPWQVTMRWWLVELALLGAVTCLLLVTHEFITPVPTKPALLTSKRAPPRAGGGSNGTCGSGSGGSGPGAGGGGGGGGSGGAAASSGVDVEGPASVASTPVDMPTGSPSHKLAPPDHDPPLEQHKDSHHKAAPAPKDRSSKTEPAAPAPVAPSQPAPQGRGKKAAAAAAAQANSAAAAAAAASAAAAAAEGRRDEAPPAPAVVPDKAPAVTQPAKTRPVKGSPAKEPRPAVVPQDKEGSDKKANGSEAAAGNARSGRKDKADESKKQPAQQQQQQQQHPPPPAPPSSEPPAAANGKLPRGNDPHTPAAPAPQQQQGNRAQPQPTMQQRRAAAHKVAQMYALQQQQQQQQQAPAAAPPATAAAAAAQRPVSPSRPAGPPGGSANGPAKAGPRAGVIGPGAVAAAAAAAGGAGGGAGGAPAAPGMGRGGQGAAGHYAGGGAAGAAAGRGQFGPQQFGALGVGSLGLGPAPDANRSTNGSQHTALPVGTGRVSPVQAPGGDRPAASAGRGTVAPPSSFGGFATAPVVGPRPIATNPSASPAAQPRNQAYPAATGATPSYPSNAGGNNSAAYSAFQAAYPPSTGAQPPATGGGQGYAAASLFSSGSSFFGGGGAGAGWSNPGASSSVFSQTSLFSSLDEIHKTSAPFKNTPSQHNSNSLFLFPFPSSSMAGNPGQDLSSLFAPPPPTASGSFNGPNPNDPPVPTDSVHSSGGASRAPGSGRPN